MRAKVCLLGVLVLLLSTSATALNLTIIESQSINPSFEMDDLWKDVVSGMGHTPTIVSMTTLDTNLFFSNTDILIVSAGVTNLYHSRVKVIAKFLKTGKPVYLQSEYTDTLSTNIGFDTLVSMLGSSFRWTRHLTGNLDPVKVFGDMGTTKNTVKELDYFWYAVAGKGDCNVVPFLEKNGEHIGFHFFPNNQKFGSLITTTDQDWLNQSYSLELMENIITNLLSSKFNSINLGQDTTLCSGDTLLLNAGTHGANYRWHDKSTDSIFVATVPGTIWVRVNVNGCITTDTINIDYRAFSLGADTVLCEGDSLTLEVTVLGDNYLWNDSLANAPFIVSNAGIYWVKMDIGECAIVDSISISYNSVTKVDLGKDTTLCAGESLLLKAPRTNEVMWSNGTGDSFLTVDKPGPYWVKVGKAPCAMIDSIQIFYDTIPSEIFLGKDTMLCHGDSLDLNAGKADDFYEWSDGSKTPNLTVARGGKYWVKVGEDPCAATDTIFVSYHPSTKINLGRDTALCEGDSLRLTTGAAIGPNEWSNGSKGSTLMVKYSDSYWVRVGQAHCSGADTIDVSFIRAPEVEFSGDTTMCKDQLLHLDLTDVNGEVTWSNGSNEPFLKVEAPGLYWAVVEDGPCLASDTIIVSYNSLPEIELGSDTTLCDGDSLQLVLNGTDYQYEWSNGSQAPVLTVVEQGEYWVKVHEDQCTNSDTISISYLSIPRVDLGVDSSLCYESDFVLRLRGSDARFTWHNGSTDSFLAIKEPGIQWVAVTNRCGSSTDTVLFEFTDCECLIYFANAFTPNGNLPNEAFAPITDCQYEDVDFKVFNRWGQLVFHTTDPAIQWDGKFDGQVVPVGVYVYRWIASRPGSRTRYHSGAVTVVR